MSRVLAVFGTRPEAVKLAPLIQDLGAHPDHEMQVVVTGQHREMLDQVTALFGIVPDHDLNVMTHGQSLSQITSSVLTGLSELIGRLSPDLVLVQGDTTTTMAAALAAFYAQKAILHVEAGLRTGDRTSPYPEEMNRLLTTRLATLHAAPTVRAQQALLREGVSPEHVQVTGNTVIDALQRTLAQEGSSIAEDPALRAVVDVGGLERPLVVATTHRRESWGTGLARIGEALRGVARSNRGALLVVPIHRNPIVREQVLPWISGEPNVVVLEPLGYVPFARLLANARLALTDSGGVQEEAPSLNVPVLVMRDSTERPEAVDVGAARLVGTDPDGIVANACQLLSDDAVHAQMAQAPNPFGDGHASARIVAMIDRVAADGRPYVAAEPAQW